MKNFLLLVVLLSLFEIKAQNWERVDSIFNPSGVKVKTFSSPAFADFDKDGNVDLLLGSLSNNAEFFRSKGTIPSTFYPDTAMLSTVYNGSHIANGTYPTFVDLDGDNQIELAIGGYGGILYYQNTGTIQNPIWTKNDFVFANVNPQIGTDAKPAFADLDGDGDLDMMVGIGESLFGGPTPGITLGFRNTGGASSPNFVLDNSLVVGIPDIGRNSYPTFVDLDNDGDIDLLLGRDLQTFLYYVNTGTRLSPIWTQNNFVFSVVEATTYWKTPVFVDIDKDNDQDLVYGTSDGILYVYENKGTITAPSFQLNSSYFSVIKVEGASTVSFGDIDKNGTIDLISGNWTGKLIYLKNNGTNSNPKFAKTTSSFTGLTVSSYSSPVFVDLDLDNDLDIAMGALAGTISYFINTNGAFTANTSIFGTIDIGFFSHPTFADIDNDGDIDLLIGAETASSTTFYKNTGNNVFVADNSMVANVVFPSNSRPTFADVDNDGDFDLLIGRSNGALVYYENKGTRDVPNWQLNTTLFAGISVKQNAAPGFADLDGDTRPDLVIGEYNGNFTYYKNLFAPVSVKNENVAEIPSHFSLKQNYPNPFNPSTVISYQLPVAGRVSLKIYDMLGKEVATLVNEELQAGKHSVLFNSNSINSGLSSGIYFYELRTSSGFRAVKKLMLMK